MISVKSGKCKMQMEKDAKGKNIQVTFILVWFLYMNGGSCVCGRLNIQRKWKQGAGNFKNEENMVFCK